MEKLQLAKVQGGGRRIMGINKFTFYSISLANFAAPRPRTAFADAPALELWLANAA